MSSVASLIPTSIVDTCDSSSGFASASSSPLNQPSYPFPLHPLPDQLLLRHPPSSPLHSLSSSRASPLVAAANIINESEFPSLGVRGTASPGFSPLPTTSRHSPVPYGRDGAAAAAALQQRANYATLMRGGDGSMTSNSEFHIQNEDFPALPGANLESAVNLLRSGSASELMAPSEGGRGGSLIGSPAPSSAGGTGGGAGTPERPSELRQAGMPTAIGSMTTQQPMLPPGIVQQQTATAASNATAASTAPGIQMHPNGDVTGIPGSMLADQFGMAGLVTYLRSVDQPSIVSLALGMDLTTLGLNLNLSERHLYTTFGGPWADYPCRTQDLDAKVPEEYLTNSTIRDKLPNIKLNKLNEDVLFFLFYNCPGEVYQMAAASELYSRDWRFHKGEQVWLTRSQYGGVKEQTASYERGSYNVFDPLQWRKIPKDMKLEYKELEDRPKLPQTLQMSSMSYQNNFSTAPSSAATTPNGTAAGPFGGAAAVANQGATA